MYRNGNFWYDVRTKFFENILSMKWWIIVFIVLITTMLVMEGLMTGGEFVTINTTLISVVAGMREIFKVAKIKQLDDKKEIERMMP